MLNNLLNNLVTVKTNAITHSTLFSSGVFEAVVLSSSPLLNEGKVVKNQFQISLQATAVNNQPKAKIEQALKQNLIEFVSQQALPKDSKVQLQINNNQTANIISVVDKQGKVIFGKPVELPVSTGHQSAPPKQTTNSPAALNKHNPLPSTHITPGTQTTTAEQPPRINKQTVINSQQPPSPERETTHSTTSQYHCHPAASIKQQ